ncbi:MAG: NAD-dependent SIR2 family protein deacetylase [Alteromonadaceae bacterium]|jgi:NAD-dependent SIR2 family protein deacetylase
MNKQQKTKHWQNIFEQQQCSDLTIIQFCRDNKINVSTFYGWRKRLADKTQPIKPQQVIPFVIHEQPLTQHSMIKITTPTGYQLDFDSTLMPQTLSQLLSAL